MTEMIWELVVKEDARGQFEPAYGPGGAWSKLFAWHSGFRGLTLLRDTKDPRRYLTIELWESDSERGQALSERKAEHSEFETAFHECVESVTDVGTFRVLAEAAVHPRGRAGRGRAEDARRRSRRTTG